MRRIIGLLLAFALALANAPANAAPVQWKIALGWMRDANMAASGSHGLLTPAATRKIAEYHLDRYFEMVEAQLTRPAG